MCKREDLMLDADPEVYLIRPSCAEQGPLGPRATTPGLHLGLGRKLEEIQIAFG
jgi:hypothetical protein